MKRGIIKEFKHPEDVVYNLHLRLFLGMSSHDAYKMFDDERTQFQTKYPGTSDFYFLYPQRLFIEKYLENYESNR